MESALQVLTDQLEISNLLAHYATALDTRNWAGLADVFLAEASCDYGSLGSPQGIDEITRLVSGTLRTLDATQHLIGNVVVKVDGDRADASCYLIAQHLRAATPGGEHYLIGGIYTDQVVRTPDGWRIAHRALTRLWTTGNRDVIQRP